MQNYFKIPIKNGYLDIDTAEDTPIKLVYDENMEFAFILLEYRLAKKTWQPITKDEFNEIYPDDIPSEPLPHPAQDIQSALVSLQQMSLMRSLGVEIPLEQQAEMEVKALANIELPTVGDEWKTGLMAKKDIIVTYNGKQYKCLQAHTTQINREPDRAVSLWVEMREEYDEWKQPTGAHDAYKKGDKVTFNGKRYESLIDGNAHSPAAYPAGWKLIE